MPTIQKFNFSWPEGVEPVNFHQWVNNLSPAERLEFDLAEERQQEIRKQKDDALVDLPHNIEIMDEEDSCESCKL